MSRWGGGGQVQPAGGGGGRGQVSELTGGGSGPASRGGGQVQPGGGVSQRGGVSILRPLAGSMPLAFTQEVFLVKI